MKPRSLLSRRTMLKASVAGVSTALGASCVANRTVWGQAGEADAAPTDFQLACMTLPYSGFPLFRALAGIKSAGYDYVAWGTRHRESNGERVPVMPQDAPPAQARELGNRCRDLGLTPLMMFSTIYPEKPDALKVLTNRLHQASAAGIPQVLTFGHTEGGNREVWTKRFKQLGPIARDRGVLLVVKQHGGSTGTGEACAEIIRDVNDPGVMVNYDAGNVMDYLNLDPLPDIRKCADVVRSFCIKDHRNWPVDQDCGPGYGEIDHWSLLYPVSKLGLKMPLCCENIFPPVISRPSDAAQVDFYAQRARQYLEVVVGAFQKDLPPS